MRIPFFKVLLCLGFFPFIALSANCAQTLLLYPPGGFRLPAGSKVLVLPFENFSNYPGGGEIASDLVALELKKGGELEVHDRKVLERTRDRSKELPQIQRYGLPEGILLGRALEVQYVIGGIITEMGYLREHRGINEKTVFAGLLWIADPRTGKRVHTLSFSSRYGSDFLPQRPTLTDQLLKTLSPFLEEILPQSPRKSSGDAHP